jgi:hypothetical protein
VRGSTNAAWSLRCPIDLPDSAQSAVAITGFNAYAIAGSDLTTQIVGGVYRRGPKANTTRQVLTSCAVKPSVGVPTECAATANHAADDANSAYYVEFSVPNPQGAYWTVSGARITYTLTR